MGPKCELIVLNFVGKNRHQVKVLANLSTLPSTFSTCYKHLKKKNGGIKTISLCENSVKENSILFGVTHFSIIVICRKVDFSFYKKARKKLFLRLSSNR